MLKELTLKVWKINILSSWTLNNCIKWMKGSNLSTVYFNIFYAIFAEILEKTELKQLQGKAG